MTSKESSRVNSNPVAPLSETQHRHSPSVSFCCHGSMTAAPGQHCEVISPYGAIAVSPSQVRFQRQHSPQRQFLQPSHYSQSHNLRLNQSKIGKKVYRKKPDSSRKAVYTQKSVTHLTNQRNPKTSRCRFACYNPLSKLLRVGYTLSCGREGIPRPGLYTPRRGIPSLY